MTQRYGNWLNILVPTKAIGNALGAQVSTEPGDAQAFDSAPAVYPAGTTFQTESVGPLTRVVASNPPAGYYLGVCCTDSVRALCEQLIAAGLPAGVVAQVGDRAELEPAYREFISAAGYSLP